MRRLQPSRRHFTAWVLSYMLAISCLVGGFESCCIHLNLPEEMLRCTQNSSIAQRDQSIMFATFVSDNIYSYAGNNMLFNAAYFEAKNYPLRILSQHTGDDYYPTDRRWNKIKAVSNALLQWANNSTYLVFIDADLVIVDPEFDVLDVIAAYPTANLIVASDAIDTANTGFMIVRNCPWSIDFFNRWWAGRELADSFCDQHVLNKLLKNATDHNFVGITPFKAINSQWPAIDNYHEDDAILHLMGETDEIRNAVSLYFAESICNSTTSTQNLVRSGAKTVPRVPLTREKLVDIRLQSVQAAWNLSTARSDSVNAQEEDFDQLHRLLGHECNRVKRASTVGTNDADDLCQRMLHEALNIHSKHVEFIAAESKAAEQTGNAMRQERLVEHLTLLVMLQFNVLELTVARFSSESVIISAAQQVLSQIDLLQGTLNMHTAYNVAFTRHKRGLVFGLLGAYYQRAEQHHAALAHEKVCITELAGALEHITHGQLEFAGVVLAYVHSAARLAELFRRKARLLEAQEWATIALNNANLLYASGNNEERQRVTELARIHALCQRVYADLHHAEKEAWHARAVAALVGPG